MAKTGVWRYESELYTERKRPLEGGYIGAECQLGGLDFTLDGHRDA
jgi:hypothetical protein